MLKGEEDWDYDKRGGGHGIMMNEFSTFRYDWEEW